MFNNTILGVIYLIKHKTCDDKKVYIGSSINLKQRIIDHKKACNNEKCKQYNYNLYKYIRENGGINMYEFIILECYVCNFKYELYDRENDYIQMYDNNLNTFRAYLTGREIKEIKKKYYDENKDKIKKYYEENKDIIKDINKKYRDENKEKEYMRHKKYYDENKDKIKEIKKKYYDENKEKIKEKLSEKITCECGGIVTKNNMSKHRKTLKHIHYTEKK